MLIDATHRRWIVATAMIFIAASACYVPYQLSWSVNGPRGSTWPGLAYGIAGTALIFFAGLLGVRRKLRSWNLGRAETWLKAHIWLGLLAYPLIVFHAGFRLGGALTAVLMVVFTLVELSGIHGLVVQHVIPRLMTVQVPSETMYEQIGTYIARLRIEARASVTTACGPLTPEEAAAAAAAAAAGRSGLKPVAPIEGSGPLKDFFLSEIDPFLETGGGRLAIIMSRNAVFSHMKTLLPPALHPVLVQLEEGCEERRQLATQVRLHHWLHGWLLVHLPLAAVLIALTVVHAVAALYY
jgi:hypothetical protein